MKPTATTLSNIFIYEDNAYLIPNRPEDLSLVLRAINEDSPIRMIYLSTFKGIIEIDVVKEHDNIALLFENSDNKTFSINTDNFEDTVDNFAVDFCEYIIEEVKKK